MAAKNPFLIRTWNLKKVFFNTPHPLQLKQWISDHWTIHQRKDEIEPWNMALNRTNQSRPRSLGARWNFIVRIRSICAIGLAILGSLWLPNRSPPNDQLASKGCPGFAVEFNTYSISGDESHVAYLFLAGSSSFKKFHRAYLQDEEAIPVCRWIQFLKY